MKLLPILTFLCAGPFLSKASAVVLFSDNFNVNTGSYIPPNNAALGPNHEAGNPGRQGGTLAAPTLGYLFAGNAQVGNTTTLAAAPGSDLGDEMLLSATAVRIDYNFSAIGTPIEISFNGLPNKNADQTNWLSFMVGDASDTFFVNNGTLDFGILFRANGGTQYFTDGQNATTGGSGSAVGSNAWASYKIVLSDSAGTGSAFGTGSSRVDYYQNGTLLGTVPVSSPFTASQGYFAFGTGDLSGVDSLVISSIPEPSTVLLVPACLGLAVLHRRRKS